MSIFKITCISILLLSTSLNAIADDDAEKHVLERSERIKLGEIVISATRSPAKLSEVSAFGTVISRKQLEKSATNNLGEFLRSADFVQILDYGPSSLSSISIRGASGAQVLVLVDGERVNDVQNGFADLDKISLDGVNRIEVIRGGQSALYGADATGGIINIITENSFQNQIELRSETGALGYLLWNASIERKFDDLSGTASYSQSQSDGDFEFEDKFGMNKVRENADYLKRNAFAKIKWQPRKSTDLSIAGQHSYSDCGEPGLIGQYSPDAFRKDLVNSLEIKLNEQIKENWKCQSDLFGRNSRQHYFNSNGLVKIDDIHKVRSFGGRLQIAFFRDELPFVTAGASVRKDKLSNTATGEHDRLSIGFYLQQMLKFQSVAIYPALRFDKYSDFDAGLSPKLGILLRMFNGQIGIKANVGRSYRAPTMNDLYWTEDAFAVGNPELQPERSKDFDFGVELKSPIIADFAWINGGIAYFRNAYNDLIQWAPGRSGKWSPTNLSEAKISGIETSLNFSATEFFRIGASYTFLQAHDSLDRQLMYRPRHSANYHLDLDLLNAMTKSLHKKFWIQLNGKYQSKRYYTRENTKWLDQFLAHDLRVGATRSIAKHIDLTGIFEVSNVFDVDYQLQADYPLPGRQWRFKMVMEWRRGENEKTGRREDVKTRKRITQ